VVLPKEKGLEREAVSWYTKMYPRTQAPDWPSARPVEIIQVCCAPHRKMFMSCRICVPWLRCSKVQ